MRFELGVIIQGDIVQGAIIQGDIVRGVIVQGDIVQGGYCPGGYCLGGILSRGMLSGRIMSGGYCPGDIVLEPRPIHTSHIYYRAKTYISHALRGGVAWPLHSIYILHVLQGQYYIHLTCATGPILHTSHICYVANIYTSSHTFHYVSSARLALLMYN